MNDNDENAAPDRKNNELTVSKQSDVESWQMAVVMVPASGSETTPSMLSARAKGDA